MKKILLVDDEEPIVRMYSDVLEQHYQVIPGRNGEEAITLAKKEKPDLIYLDIIMPKLNGLDVLKQLKSDKEVADIPVVLLTNLPKEASADKAMNLGATDYFVKVDNTPDKINELTKQLIGE